VSGMAKHLAACSKRHLAMEISEIGKGSAETLYHLHVKDAYRSEYWLDLEMAGSKTLKHLDHYLRQIWLECCGHLSRFTTGGWQGKKLAMVRRIDEVLGPGIELTHIYDFGTSSLTQIKVVGTREGAPTTNRPIALMARDLMPVDECIECGHPATRVCMECVIEENTWGTLCDEHARTHPHEEYGTLPLVNSPRVGMCGYEGPADPPY
jgi:hypothetical protein